MMLHFATIRYMPASSFNSLHASMQLAPFLSVEPARAREKILQTLRLLATMECYYPKRAVRGESHTGMKHPLKAQGFVRTPPFIAALLARWALRTPTDHVLDAGFGEGVFLLESTRRLLALGASVQHLAAQLHGVASHPDAVQGLQRTFRSYGLPTELPGVRTGDFFETEFPHVDVLIGNPPYVRRWWQKDVDALQVIAEQVQDVSN